MALTFTNRETEGVAIVDLEGCLTFGLEDLLFRSLIDQAVSAGTIWIVLNLDGVKHIDLTGVGSLMFALSELRKAGGGLALFNFQPADMEPVVVAKLEAALGVFGTQEDAVNSFFPDRRIKHYDILEYVSTERHKDERSQQDPGERSKASVPRS